MIDKSIIRTYNIAEEELYLEYQMGERINPDRIEMLKGMIESYERRYDFKEEDRLTNAHMYIQGLSNYVDLNDTWIPPVVMIPTRNRSIDHPKEKQVQAIKDKMDKRLLGIYNTHDQEDYEKGHKPDIWIIDNTNNGMIEV